MSLDRGVRVVHARDFFVGYRNTLIEPDELLITIEVDYNKSNHYVSAFQQCRRREDDIAIVTSCLGVSLDPTTLLVQDVSLVFGGMGVTTRMSPKTSAFLKGRVWDDCTFSLAMDVLKSEMELPVHVPGGMSEYRTSLCLGFFYKFYLSVRQQARGDVPPQFLSARGILESSIPEGEPRWNTPTHGKGPIGEPILHASSERQVTGEAVYVDDIPKRPNELVAVLVVSDVPHARILKIDASKALEIPGVRFFDHSDVPGGNDMGDVFPDEELFASKMVTSIYQTIGVVVADDVFTAHKAKSLVKVEYEPLQPILSIDDAIKHNSFFPLYQNSISRGDVDVGFSESDHVLEGNVYIGGQEHFYFEPNVTLAEPVDTEMKIFSSTQNIHKTQSSVAHSLGLPDSKVSASVRRVGGGFGGKETNNIRFSCAAAVAAYHTGRPVRILLQRDEDMKFTGKRHPFKANYKIGFMTDGSIKALDLQLYNNGGNWYDLSGAVLERALFHSDNSYYIPNLRTSGKIAKTNIQSNTAFRGFGGPQGVLAVEYAIQHVAEFLNIPPEIVRENHLYKYSQETHFRMPVNVRFDWMWKQCMKQSRFVEKVKERDEFNRTNRYKKRGLSIVPSKFGLAFTFTTLNQGAALVHVYLDGSVLISHGGVEMGQGLNTKCLQIASHSLGIPLEKIYISETSSDKIPNSSPTAASMGSDIYGMAVLKACEEINQRLQPYKDADPTAGFERWAKRAWLDRVNLSAQGFWKVPVGGFDFKTGKGEPFAYFTCGVAVSEVVIDTLTGDHRILSSDILFDMGKSINPNIDIGQIEGAFVQGVGWLTTEELVWGDDNHLWIKPGHSKTTGPGNYKIPCVDDIPRDFNVTLVEASDDSRAVHSSRGVGEPPILLANSVVFAIRDAIKSARADFGVSGFFDLPLPYTCERIRMACVDDITSLCVKPPQEARDFRTFGSW
eukprot:TRINITY_DN3870_c0_g1_i2.p1 TRINITY_DN3870_c0_g1~~TRINITY_DN3870_c0_g1_i2.p1  ORF type:complete len:1079 (-),score=234.65 TRINITY_DN3870_c0_g1_i2:3157-6012(-)